MAVGATKAEWQKFVSLGLTADLLPVVSDTSKKISPNSKLKDLGKTPSVLNRDGEVAGLAGWTGKESTATQVAVWQRNNAYGACLQTRHVRAIDVDIADAKMSAGVRSLIEGLLGPLPCRSRANSGRLVLAFRLESDQLFKRKIPTGAGEAIELLATGQQFVVAGTHPSGARYEWSGLGDHIPEVSLDELNEVWALLAEAYAVVPVEAPGTRAVTSHDSPTRGLNESEIAELLDVLDPSMSYDDWIKVGQAVHHETRGAGLHLWDAWSQAGEYPGYEALEDKWGTFGRNSGAAVTAGTLLHMAGTAAAAKGIELSVGKPSAEGFPVADMIAGNEEEWPTFERNKAGKIEPTITNAVLALRHAGFSQTRLAHDRFKESTMVAYDGDAAWRALKDTDYTRMRLKLEARGFKAPGRELTRDAALAVAEENAFDSAIQWAESLKWDGVPRVDTFLHRYFRTENTPYATATSRYLWTALAGRLLTPGERVHMVVVLVGSQGSGKSMGVQALAPEEDSYVKINLENRDDNQSRLMRGKLVGELDELRGLQSRDAEGIKAWITNSFEEWTPKYMEHAIKMPRRIVFVGTTNDDDFLCDPTGERRWLPVRVGVTDVQALERDRDQLWAEGLAMYRRLGVHWSDAFELAKAEHEEFKSEDAWAPDILAWLQREDLPDAETGVSLKNWQTRVSIPALMKAGLGLNAIQVTHTGLTKRVAAVLIKLGFEKKRGTGREGKSVWVATEKTKTFM